MMKKLAAMALLVSFLLLAACHEQQTIKGNGSRETVARSIAPFDSIQLDGSYDVILVGQMPQQVALTADSNVQQYVTTTVKDKTLYIATAPKVHLVTQQSPMLEIFVPSLTGITVSGSGTVNATKISADKLSIQLSGTGRVYVAGAVNKMNVALAGAGEVNSQDLNAKEADINVSGSGRVSVNPSEQLKVKVSGSGLIEYYGAPSSVTQDISGSGKVIGISANAQKNSN